MGATSIQINTWTKLSQIETFNTTAVATLINPARIISVSTRATAYRTTGIVDIVYELPVNQNRYQVTLIVTQTQAALLTALNANVIAT